jgi:hypothetical protein
MGWPLFWRPSKRNAEPTGPAFLFCGVKPLQLFGLVPEIELLLSEFDDVDLDLHFPFLDHIDFLRRPAGENESSREVKEGHHLIVASDSP